LQKNKEAKNGVAFCAIRAAAAPNTDIYSRRAIKKEPR
jgi:hypothetical protein